MTNKQRLYTPDNIFFITITCYKWIPLFAETDLYDEIYKSLQILIDKKCSICGFVIMPNHLHLLIYIPERHPSQPKAFPDDVSRRDGKEDGVDSSVEKPNKTIDKLIGNFKRFLAYEIVARLKRKGDAELLKRLEEGVVESDRKRGKKHEVFQPSFDCKLCATERFILQKLHYIHHNPVAKHWSLTEDFSTFEHSSAKFYEHNELCKIPVTHWEDVGG